MFSAFSALNESEGESLISNLGDVSLETSNLGPSTGGDWREAQDEAMRLYQEALRLYAKQEYKQSIQKLEDVHRSTFLRENPAKIPLEYQAVLEKLRFNCSKYLGFSYRRFKRNDKALEHLLNAYKLDSSDVVLSYEAGVCALANNKWLQARATWENALRKSASALHWPSLEGLIGLTFRTGDHFACQAYIDRALSKDPKYARGLKIQSQLWDVPEDPPHLKNVIVSTPKWVTRSLVIRPSFESFLDTLLGEYHRLSDQGSLHLPYKLTCARRPELKVSIQNESESMTDFTDETYGFSGLLVQTFVDEIIEGVFTHSQVAMVEEILLGIVEQAASEAHTSVRTTLKRSKSFLEAVPMELMEIRRSSRAKCANPVVVAPVVPTVAELPPPEDEFNALSFLQSLVPTSLQSQNSNLKSREKNRQKSAVEEDESKEQLTEALQKIKVKKFLSDHEDSGPINHHIIDTLHAISLTEMLPWPESLAEKFVQCYWTWRKHFVLPNEFELCATRDDPPDFSHVILLANELTVHLKSCEKLADFEERYEEDVLHLRMIRSLLGPSKGSRLDFLEFKYHHKSKQLEQATNCGQKLLHVVDFDQFPTSYVVSDYFVPKLRVKELLKSMECAQLEDKVEDYFTAQNYAQVVEILSPTLDHMTLPSSGLFFWIQKYYLLIESLWEIERFDLCIDRCAQVLKILDDRELLLKAKDDTNQLIKFVHCSWSELKPESRHSLSSSIKENIIHVLVQVLATQIEVEESPKDVLPWCMLYELILSEEIEPSPDTLSTSFLVSAHDYMGQLSLCTQRNGELLQALVKRLGVALSGDDSELQFTSVQRENWKKCVDQALFCLYSHPSKKTKAKHLCDHGVPQLALTWNKCEEIFHYLKPKEVPNLVDPKSMSISVDTEMMFNRILALVPETFSLAERKTSIKGYIRNHCMERPSFESNLQYPRPLRDLFFLLADYHFKNGDQFEKAIDLLYTDISFNPRRADAWILLALSLIKLLEEKINLNDKNHIDEVLNEANSAQICCQKVLLLDKNCHSIFLTETANFTYEIVSYCSYILKSDDITDLTLEAFGKLERAKCIYSEQSMKYYELSYQRINKHIDALESDDRWLVSLMKGKLCEKVKEPFLKAFGSYSRAVKNLFEQCGTVSKKISYNNPTQFSLELIESLYRIHASTLKNLLKPMLDMTVAPINNQDLKIVHETLKDIHDLDILGMSGDLEEIPNDIDRPQRIEKLFEYCLLAFESILTRFSHHFKSLHMLAYFYAKTPKRRQPEKALTYLISNPIAPKPTIPPLFTEKKTHNFFNGIWRFPVPDFDRPGNFFKHIAKSVTLCLELCEELSDHATLAEITWHLRKPMDKDKVYLFEKDRAALSMEARTKLVKVLQAKTTRVDAVAEDGNTLLLIMFHIYNKLKKSIPQTIQIKKMIQDVFGRRARRNDASCDEALAYCLALYQNEKRLAKIESESSTLDVSQLPTSNSNTILDPPTLVRKAVDPLEAVVPPKIPKLAAPEVLLHHALQESDFDVAQDDQPQDLSVRKPIEKIVDLITID